MFLFFIGWAGFRQCVLVLEVHISVDSLRGWRGVVRDKHRLGPPNQNSIQIHPFRMCTPWPTLATKCFLMKGKLGFRFQNQDSDNVYLCWKYTFLLTAWEDGEGLCERSIAWVPKTRIQSRFHHFRCVPLGQVLRPSVF